MNIAIVDNNRLLPDLMKVSFLKLNFINSVNVYTCPIKYLAHLNIVDTNFLIIDILLQQMPGLDLIKQLRKSKTKQELKVLILTEIKNPTLITEAFKAGVNGYICKDSSPDELIKAIKFINQESTKTYVGKSIKELLLQAQFSQNTEYKLSPREKELLFLLCSGKTVKDIAITLQLSLLTVQSYLKQLMRKMEVKRTPELILKAIQCGLFHPIYTPNIII